jgi:hypothetical protein
MPKETVLKEELAFYFLLGLRFIVVALSSSRLTRGYLRICMIRNLNKSVSEEHH